MSMMWKYAQSPTASDASNPGPEPVRFESSDPANEYSGPARVTPVAANQAAIGKGMVFKGMVTGAGSLFVDGEVVGNIDVPDSRVTVGPAGQVSDGLSVCIHAREIVIIGRVRGNIAASERVEIRSSGVLVGNVSAARIRIEDGAFFKGDIDLRAPRAKPVLAADMVEEQEDTRARAYA